MPRYPSNDDWRKYTDAKFTDCNTVTCKIVNSTKHTWHWEDFRLQDYSNFGYSEYLVLAEVKKELQPGQSTELIILAQRRDPGVEVWVIYNTPAGPLEFHFNNPYIGSNSYDTYKLPGEFESIHNSAPEWHGTPYWDNPYYTRRIDGNYPRFEWTIKQR